MNSQDYFDAIAPPQDHSEGPDLIGTTRSLSLSNAEKSEQAEENFDSHADRNGSPVPHRRLESPGPYRLHGLFVEPEA